MKKAIVFDLDNTIADNSHRVHLIKTQPPDWDGFYMACLTDKVIRQTWMVLTALREQFKNCTFIACTGRSSKYLSPTEAWMKMYQVPYDEIFMRTEGDRRPDYECKADMMDEIMREYEILMVFEDKPKVCDEWEKRGAFVYRIKGDED